MRDEFVGRANKIRAERDRKLEQARGLQRKRRVLDHLGTARNYPPHQLSVDHPTHVSRSRRANTPLLHITAPNPEPATLIGRDQSIGTR
ncbi:MAG TPA: hypothetical protein VGB85_34285 [Nannocystis sp.]|jgi:hypothetical protein